MGTNGRFAAAVASFIALLSTLGSSALASDGGCEVVLALTQAVDHQPLRLDPGGGNCSESWTERRTVETRRPNGWYYASVVCGAVGGAATYASGLVNFALGLTVAVVFGASCTAMTLEAQYETVLVTQTRQCGRRWIEAARLCRTDCTAWRECC